MWIETIPDYNREGLLRVLRILSPREEAIVRSRFGIDSDPKTLAATGEDFGITSERVRQIVKKSIKKLRWPHRNKTYFD